MAVDFTVVHGDELFYLPVTTFVASYTLKDSESSFYEKAYLSSEQRTNCSLVFFLGVSRVLFSI